MPLAASRSDRSVGALLVHAAASLLPLLVAVGCNGDSDPPVAKSSGDESSVGMLIEPKPASPGSSITVRVAAPHAACYTLTPAEPGLPAFDLTSDGGPEADLEGPAWYPEGQGSCEDIEVEAGSRERLVLPDTLESADYTLCVPARDRADVCGALPVE